MKRLLSLLAVPCAIAFACGGTSDTFGPGPAGGSSGKAAGGASGEAADASGGSSAAAGKPATGGIPLDAVPEAYATAYCALIERCEGFLYDLLTAYEDCVKLTAERQRQSGFDALTAAVDEGRVEYHPERMQACLDAVEARACNTLTTRGIDECESALTGTAAAGESCELNEECEGSLICETGDACPGQCKARYAAGIACSVDDECADGLVCSSITAHCVKPAQKGQACEGGVEAQCDAGLFCSGSDASKMQPGSCVPIEDVVLGDAGEACDPSGSKLCASGLSCVLTGLENKALTWECRVPGGSGATCGVGLPEDCPGGEYCPLGAADIVALEFTAKCEALPASGAACASRPLASIMPACAPYSRCGSDGKCIQLRDLGESCSGDNVCYSSDCASGACEPAHVCN